MPSAGKVSRSCGDELLKTKRPKIRTSEIWQPSTIPDEPRTRKRKRDDSAVTESRVRPTAKNVFAGEVSSNVTIWDQRKAQWVMKDSRPPPMVLVQVQANPLQGPFTAAPAKVIAMLADNGAQIDCANNTIFDALGVKPEDREKYLRPSEVTVNGVGGKRTAVKELKVHIYSLKTKQTHRVTFHVGNFTSNILSEQTLYDLGYLDVNIFREDNLYKAGKQKEYITNVNANKHPMFGSVGHEEVVVMKCCNRQNCAHATYRGNLNSGGKRNPKEKLKDECKRLQYIVNGAVKQIIKETRKLQEKTGVWDEIAQEAIKDSIRRIFHSSAFNTCTTQKLPVMSGQPMKISIDETKFVRPVNVQKPYNVPVHCKEAVHQQLLENNRMGIIEPVPVNDTSPDALP